MDRYPSGPPVPSHIPPSDAASHSPTAPTLSTRAHSQEASSADASHASDGSESTECTPFAQLRLSAKHADVTSFLRITAFPPSCCSPSSSPSFSLADDPYGALIAQTLNPDGTPKRPMNAFLLFARQRRPEISAENAAMRTGEVSKILSKEWTAMPADKKQFYQEQAKRLKDNFNQKYPEYVYTRRPNHSRKRRRTGSGELRRSPPGTASTTPSIGGAASLDAESLADSADSGSPNEGHDEPVGSYYTPSSSGHHHPHHHHPAYERARPTSYPTAAPSSSDLASPYGLPRAAYESHPAGPSSSTSSSTYPLPYGQAQQPPPQPEPSALYAQQTWAEIEARFGRGPYYGTPAGAPGYAPASSGSPAPPRGGAPPTAAGRGAAPLPHRPWSASSGPTSPPSGYTGAGGSAADLAALAGPYYTTPAGTSAGYGAPVKTESEHGTAAAGNPPSARAYDPFGSHHPQQEGQAPGYPMGAPGAYPPRSIERVLPPLTSPGTFGGLGGQGVAGGNGMPGAQLGYWNRERGQ